MPITKDQLTASVVNIMAEEQFLTAELTAKEAASLYRAFGNVYAVIKRELEK